MRYSIIHHPSRQINPSIMRELDKVMIYTDNHDEGCTAMHLKALADAEEAYEPTVIIEDDAILCHGFAELAQYYCDIVIGESDDIDAVSFYIGKGAPTYIQDVYRESIEKTISKSEEYFYLPALYHALCYAVNPRLYPKIVKLIEYIANRKRSNTVYLQTDELLSNKLHNVAYVYPCLADHDDSQPSVVEHEGIRPTIPRVAWKFRG